jgi:hypothetical protein
VASYPGSAKGTKGGGAHSLSLSLWREKQWPISYLQANPKRAEFNGMPSKSFVRYGGYKGAPTISAAIASGASAGDVKWNLEHGYMALHPPSEDRVLGPLPSDGGEAKYDAWLMARLVLLPEKGGLSLLKNWRRICLLDVASNIFSLALVGLMGVVMEKFGYGAQVGFRWDRNTIGGLFTTFVGLSKRKEHGLETRALFINLVKAFDTAPRRALFAVLRRLGLPDHFGRISCTKRDRWGEEAEEGETWGRVAESLIRASGISLGASGVVLVQLRHREGLVVRRSGRQEEGRREAPRQALRRAPRLRVVGRLLRSLDNLGRATAGAVEAAASSVHVERVDGALSRLVPPPPLLRPKALLRQKEGGDKLEEGLNAALHKTSPHQGERPRPRRERR